MCCTSGSPTAMLVPDFGPTMNVIAYWPFQDAASAEAVGGSDRAVASNAAQKPTRLLRRSAATILDIYPSAPLRHSLAAKSRDRTLGLREVQPLRPAIPHCRTVREVHTFVTGTRSP